MFESTPLTGRPLALLLALACWGNAVSAQSSAIQHPGASKGFDPQPDPPGKQMPVGRLPVGLPIIAGADVTYKNGILIGQTFAPWGTMVTIPEGQAYSIERGKCAFRIRYGMSNLGSAPTAVIFKNTLAADASVVSTDDSLLLNGLQFKEVGTHAWLSPGTYNLILRLDAGNTVSETNEVNNVVRVRLTLNGTCQGQVGVNIPKVPGEEKAHVPFVPPGTPNTADQTDEKPAPQAHTRLVPPGTANAADQTNEKPAPHVHPGQAGYDGPDSKGSAIR